MLVVRRLPTPSQPLSVHPLTFTNTPKVSPFCPFLTSLVRDAISSGPKIWQKSHRIPYLGITDSSVRPGCELHEVVVAAAVGARLKPHEASQLIKVTTHCALPERATSKFCSGKTTQPWKKVRFSFLYRFPPFNAFIHASHILL